MYFVYVYTERKYNMQKQVQESLNNVRDAWTLSDDDEARNLACEIFVSDLEKYHPDTYRRLVKILND